MTRILQVSGDPDGGFMCQRTFLNQLIATVYHDVKNLAQEYHRGKALYPVKTIGETTERGTEVTFFADDKRIFQVPI